MNDLIMEDKIKKVIEKIDFANRYATICNSFPNFNNGKAFTKQELLNVFDENNIIMTFRPKEKIFFKEYNDNDYIIRFVVSYKYGFIDCLYLIQKNNNIIINESFRGISLIIDEDFNDKISYRFPIATSLYDLKIILDLILSLNNDFINELKST